MVYVSTLALVTPIGLTPASTAVACIGGLSRLEETLFRSFGTNYVVGARIPIIDKQARARARIAQALRRVLKDTLEGPLELAWARTPVFCCVGDARRPGPRVRDIFEEAVRETPLAWSEGRFLEGSTAVLEAMGRARRLLAEGAAEACVIVASDTLFDMRTMNWLDQTRRLRGRKWADGIAPGEAAGVLLVSREPLTASALALCGLGTAEEQSTILNDAPFRGDGMTEATRVALGEAGLGMHQVDVRISDAGGESYSFEELVMSQTRLMRQVKASQPLWHPADAVGSCGAASPMVQTAYLELAFEHGFMPGPVATMHASSAFGPRAVAVFRSGVKHGA